MIKKEQNEVRTKRRKTIQKFSWNNTLNLYFHSNKIQTGVSIWASKIFFKKKLNMSII